MAKKEPNPIRYGPPSPVPKIGDIVGFLRPPQGERESARVVFVAPETPLQNRVINLEVPLPDGSVETHVNIPFYPIEVMDEDDTVIANTWHWPAQPEPAKNKNKKDGE